MLSVFVRATRDTVRCATALVEFRCRRRSPSKSHRKSRVQLPQCISSVYTYIASLQKQDGLRNYASGATGTSSRRVNRFQRFRRFVVVLTALDDAALSDAGIVELLLLPSGVDHVLLPQRQM